MRVLLKAGLFCTILFCFSFSGAFAQDIKLPEPDLKKPVLKALKNQRSVRSFDSKEVPLQLLAEVLWAGFGINRPETGGRTAPSGGGSREIDIYVVLKKGTYKYNPQEHSLDLVTNEDLRPIMFTQDYAESIPVNLAYVSNLNRLTTKLPIEYTMMHSGLVAQNVNIYCVSVGLGSVIRSPRDSGKLAEALNLREDQKVLAWHALGYPGTGGSEQAGKKGAKSGKKAAKKGTKRPKGKGGGGGIPPLVSPR